MDYLVLSPAASQPYVPTSNKDTNNSQVEKPIASKSVYKPLALLN